MRRAGEFGERKRSVSIRSISLPTHSKLTLRERRLIRTECLRQRLPIVSVCCVAAGLIDFNPSVQRFHLERTRAYLDLVYELEARNLLLVLGEYIWNREVIPPDEQWRTGAENCRRLAEQAEMLGVQIALELEPFPLSLLNNVDRMRAVYRYGRTSGGSRQYRRVAPAPGPCRPR